MIIRTVLSLALVCTTPLAAQQSSFVGVWTVSYPGGAMMDNGVMTPIMATGTLSIAVQADSLVGSLVMDPNPELGARPEVRMTAAAGAGAATFISRSEATLSTNGDTQKATVISTWKLAVAGDSLSGTVERSLEGFEMGNQPPQPVKGARQRNSNP